MTAQDLRLLHGPVIPAAMIYTSAGYYAAVDRDWLLQEFWPAWFRLNGPYAPKRVCWNFVSRFLADLQEDNAVSSGTPAGDTALAAGRWDFHPDASRGMPEAQYHSVVSFVSQQGLERMDPQNGQIWTPTESELYSTRLSLY